MLFRPGKPMRPRRVARVALFALLLSVVAIPPATAAKVAMALVLAVDVSESVDAGEYELQHEGIARAFENAEVMDTIQSVGGIDVLMLEWSDRDKQAIIAD